MKSTTFMLLSAALLLLACEKKPTACIDMPDIIEVQKETPFVSCSKDFDFLTWEYGNGSGLESEAPVYQYPNEGAYTMKLTAYSDGAYRSDEATHDVLVSFKYLDRVEVTGIFEDRILEFRIGTNSYETPVSAGTYNDSNPITFDIYDQDIIRLSGNGSGWKAVVLDTVTMDTAAMEIELAEGSANFTSVTNPYAEVVYNIPTNSYVRLYWRYKAIADL